MSDSTVSRKTCPPIRIETDPINRISLPANQNSAQNFLEFSSTFLLLSPMPFPRQPWSFASRAVNGRAECPSCSSAVAGETNYYRHLRRCSLFQKERTKNLGNQPPIFSPSQTVMQPLFSLSQPLGTVPLQPKEPLQPPQPPTLEPCAPHPHSGVRVPLSRLPVKLPPLLRMSGVHAGPISLRPTVLRQHTAKPFPQVGSRTQIERVRKLGGEVRRNVEELVSDPLHGLPQNLQIGPIPIIVGERQFEVHYAKDVPDPVEVCIDQRPPFIYGSTSSLFFFFFFPFSCRTPLQSWTSQTSARGNTSSLLPPNPT